MRILMCWLLQELKPRLEAELAKREALLSDRGHERPSDVRTTFCGDEIVACVRELIRLENASLHHREVFAAAEEAMKAGPATLTNSVVVHFGKLFDVKRLEGMFPKMNVSSGLRARCTADSSLASPLRSLQPN